jgi:hypothetical protein
MPPFLAGQPTLFCHALQWLLPLGDAGCSSFCDMTSALATFLSRFLHVLVGVGFFFMQLLLLLLSVWSAATAASLVADRVCLSILFIFSSSPATIICAPDD